MKKMNPKIEFLKAKSSKLKALRGQSVLEIIIAIAIIGITISAIIAASFGNQAILSDSKNNSEALQLAQENLEATRASAQTDFSSISSVTTTSGIFTKEIVVTSIDSTTKKVLSRVSWNTDPLRTQKIELTEIITDPVTALKSGGDPGCNDTANANWQNPQSTGSVDLGPGESATGLDVGNKIVYMTATASSSSKADFFIVDANDPANPVIKSNLETGPGLNGVDFAGHYAYIANNKTSSQLLIVDVSDVNAPSLLTSFTLPGVSGTGAIGNSILYYGSKVYIGTKKATGPEFHIIDVSNPASPVALGSFEVDADVNQIKVAGDYAYLATSSTTAQLKILNIADPSNISTAGNYAASGTQAGLSVFVSGVKVYLGRQSGSGDFLILDTTNPASIQLTGSKTLNANVDAIVQNQYISFTGTDDANNEFKILNSSNPANITLTGSVNFPQVLQSMDCEKNIIYAAMRSNDALRIITPQ